MAWERRLSLFPRIRWSHYAAALASVAAVSLAIGLVLGHTSVANISILYLLAVLISATLFGSGPAAFASIASFLVFDWFFVEPLHTFTIGAPSEWVSLTLFLITAVVTGSLAAGQRRRAQQSERREREAVVLYDVVRLIGDPDLRAALEKVAERLRSDLQVGAIALELFDDDGTVTRAISGDQGLLPDPEMLSGLSSELLAEGRIAQGTHTASPGRWVRIVPPHKTEGGDLRWPEDLHLVPIKYLGKSVGVLLLSHAPERPEFGPADDRLLSAVAVQLGIAVERRNLRQQATDAEVLRRADELKTALLNAVSHDLRTPLSSILASADSLLQKDVTWTEDEKDEFARAIGRESRRLNRIVGNLLDLSRIQGGSLRPEKDWYHLGALVDDVLGRLRPVTNQHLVSVHVQQDLPPVPLDYVEIDQVLSNLIENAAKYSPLGTEISVSARREGDSVRVEVSDHGPGIPAHLRPLLFKPFSRLEAGQLRPKGTGLGLAVARGLVEAHGGAIWIESAEGGGAVFAFTLPLGEQGEAAADGEKTA